MVWKIPEMWKGETVAIFGGGPSMSKEAAESVRQYKSIAINFAYRLAPWADMLLALDSDQDFWEESRDFEGLKVCGGSFDFPGVHYIGQRFEKIVLGVNHVIETRNSGLTALRIAAEAGAKKILLLGIDPEVHGHFADYPSTSTQDDTSAEPYPGLTIGFAQIIAELRAQGIEVERYTKPNPPARSAPINFDRDQTE